MAFLGVEAPHKLNNQPRSSLSLLAMINIVFTKTRKNLIQKSSLAVKITLANALVMMLFAGALLIMSPHKNSVQTQAQEELQTKVRLIAKSLSDQLTTIKVEGHNNGMNSAKNTLFNPDIAQSVRQFSSLARAYVFIFTPTGQLVMQASPLLARQSLSNEQQIFIKQATEQIRSQALTPFNANGFIKKNTLSSASAPIKNHTKTVGQVMLVSLKSPQAPTIGFTLNTALVAFAIATALSVGLSISISSWFSKRLSSLISVIETHKSSTPPALDAPNFVPNTDALAQVEPAFPKIDAHPDEIGRLSHALDNMMYAIHEKLHSNEKFAADVTHEIKNPLASLKSALTSLNFAQNDEQKEHLLNIMQHDVSRLDRLVNDIASASYLDSQLVKEKETEFDLTKSLRQLCEHIGEQAIKKHIDILTDFPAEPIIIRGLEGRLVQIFVNLISNAMSFCQKGDAIRVWIRKRSGRILIVVEDTGPGIPEAALTKIFERFYSERPSSTFGSHSGLGLSISKQIVEAHGGVIWAENIRPTNADPLSEPFGARFIVGLPI